MLSVGWYEFGTLNELGIQNLPIKIDTGAKTSSIHASNICLFEENGKQKVRFKTLCAQNEKLDIVASLKDIRTVKSSNGQSEKRYVIETPLTLGDETWDIELTLTCRRNMNFNMLLGRRAMENIQVIPSKANLINPELRLKTNDLDNA